MILAPPQSAVDVVLATIAAGTLGVVVAWWLRRRTTISIRNMYLATAVLAAVDVLAARADAALVLDVAVPLTGLALGASAAGRRWRLSDLGAGEELRAHEQQRRWLWQPPIARAEGETVRIATQGQIVRAREWTAGEPFVPLTANPGGPRVPRRSGRHVFTAGGTGSGKTTSALRAAAGRVLKDRAALFFLDQKGDPDAETFLRNLAALAGVPFILLDPRAGDTDHWQPLWGERPAEVVAGVLSGIEASEPYYIDVLRLHVGIVAAVLHTGGYWPPSFPLLVEAAQLEQFDRVLAVATAHADEHPELYRRVKNHKLFVESQEGAKALRGGLVRLELVIGDAWRHVLTPRHDPTNGEPVGVSLARAIGERAVVLWRTHVDQMPDEAKTITAVVLTDIHQSAVHAQASGPALWTVVLDEFGAVISSAAGQALALLQRGRTHEGQVHVITQSVADIEALTGQQGLLASMTDNFTAFIVHRQASPESRDWLAKLMGTTALWQSTDQTRGHNPTGMGSSRRVRQFRVSSDTFAELRTGEAVIHTTLGPPPQVTRVKQLQLRPADPQRIGVGVRSACELTVHPATELPRPAGSEPGEATSPPGDGDVAAATTAPRARRERPGRERQDARPLAPLDAPVARARDTAGVDPGPPPVVVAPDAL